MNPAVRRTILGVLIGLGACMIISNHAQDQQPRIAVIGAGMAGLTATHELTKMGFTHVDCYEARDERVGGKIFSVQWVTEDGRIQSGELGAENILDGGDATNARELIQELGLSTVQGTIDKATFVQYGGDGLQDPYTNFAATYGYTPDSLFEKLQELQQQYSSVEEILCALIPDDPLLQQHLRLRLCCYEGGSTKQLSTAYATTTLYYMILGGLCSVHPEENSISWLSIEGGNNRLPQAIADRLHKRLHLGHQLTKLSKQHGCSYTLTFANGLATIADIVILAIPCSVYHTITFDNAIPQDVLNAIKAVQYGQHTKILVPEHGLHAGRAACSDYMLAFCKQETHPLSMFYCDHRGYLTQDTIAAIFNRDFAFVTKDQLHVKAPATPCIARDAYLQRYACPVGYSWVYDPYAQGTYSFVAHGQEELLLTSKKYHGHAVRTLFYPVDDTLFFAGEHATILFDVSGTIEAAVESGKRTAKIIQAVHAS